MREMFLNPSSESVYGGKERLNVANADVMQSRMKIEIDHRNLQCGNHWTTLQVIVLVER